MHHILKLFIIAIMATKRTLCDKYVASLVLESGNMVVKNGIADDWVARGMFTDNIKEDGWTYLEIETSSNYPNSYQSYAAGYLEGVLTNKLIYLNWRNTQEGFCTNSPKLCAAVRKYLRANIDWMREEIHSKRLTVPLWFQVDLVLQQLFGLSAGYTSVSNNSISEEDIVLMNMNGDMESLATALIPEKRDRSIKEWVEMGGPYEDGHCSALIKLLPGNQDLLFSHVTWSGYNSMLRVLKKYIFPFRSSFSSKSVMPGHVATFSSYPGYISSMDDFYLLSSGLATVETTIGNSNPKLWQKVKPTGQLLEWIRVVVANRLATNGKEWSKIFKQYNSGTYNNQWMVVDYNKFTPGKEIQPDTLWIIEQIPGYIEDGDQSAILKHQSYWPSYNLPFYRAVYNLSGVPAYFEKYGDWFSYDMCPRAQIFRRDHHKVKDMDSLISLMRYNDFQHDPLSKCDCSPPYSAENGISARNDLNPKNGTYPFGALGHRSHGGTDVKATSSQLFKTLDFAAMSGPTYDQQPVFKWSNQDFANHVPHYGHPDSWKFPLIKTNWLW